MVQLVDPVTGNTVEIAENGKVGFNQQEIVKARQLVSLNADKDRESIVNGLWERYGVQRSFLTKFVDDELAKLSGGKAAEKPAETAEPKKRGPGRPRKDAA